MSVFLSIVSDNMMKEYDSTSTIKVNSKEEYDALSFSDIENNAILFNYIDERFFEELPTNFIEEEDKLNKFFSGLKVWEVRENVGVLQDITKKKYCADFFVTANRVYELIKYINDNIEYELIIVNQWADDFSKKRFLEIDLSDFNEEFIIKNILEINYEEVTAIFIKIKKSL